MDPEHSEMEEDLTKAREMQTSLGDEATEETVASFEKKYKLKMQLSSAATRAATAANQAADAAKIAARDTMDTAQVTVDLAQRKMEGAQHDEAADESAELARSGWLEKKGARSRDGFKKRWFELRASYLFYYEKEGGKHKGDISMGDAVSVEESKAVCPAKIACVLLQVCLNANVAQRLPVGAQEDAKPFELAVKMGDRDYRLNCADDEVSCCCNCPPTLAAH